MNTNLGIILSCESQQKQSLTKMNIFRIQKKMGQTTL